tara:strand:- start:1161 stop:1574 length:414 start_codon:yes stop_codon:yes gene_type:complete
MELKEKVTLIIITIIIDVSTLYISVNDNINGFDKYYISCMLLIHIIFVIALLLDINKIIDVCHILLFVSIFFSIFLTNKKLLFLIFSISVTQSMIKVIFGECIMCTSKDQSFGTLPDKHHQKFIYQMMGLLLYKILM